MKKHKTVLEANFELKETDKTYNYQSELTIKLDHNIHSFNQDVVN